MTIKPRMSWLALCLLPLLVPGRTVCADSRVGVAVCDGIPPDQAPPSAAGVESRIVRGQQAWVIRSDQVELTVTRLGAQTAPVTFYRTGDRPVTPFYISPWQGEGADLSSCPVLVPLRGDFFCLPFGGNATPYRGEKHPPHGETAGGPWELADSKTAGAVKSVTLTMRTRVRPGRVTRTLSLIDGQNVVYDHTVIHDFVGKTSMAHHAILALPHTPRALLVSTRPFVLGMTAPYRFSDPAKGEYQSLAIGARFADLARVPSLFKETPDADCTAFPARRGFADLLEIFSDPASPPPDWLAAVNTESNYLYFSLKDPRVLPGRVFWMENHGRHEPPWSGRNLCLGLEDGCSFFDAGLAQSASPNVVNAAGIPTCHTLTRAEPFTVNYIQGVVKVPPDFGRVADVRFTPAFATFVSTSGRQVQARVDTDFLITGQLRH